MSSPGHVTILCATDIITTDTDVKEELTRVFQLSNFATVRTFFEAIT